MILFVVPIHELGTFEYCCSKHILCFRAGCIYSELCPVFQVAEQHMSSTTSTGSIFCCPSVRQCSYAWPSSCPGNDSSLHLSKKGKFPSALALYTKSSCSRWCQRCSVTRPPTCFLSRHPRCQLTSHPKCLPTRPP